MVIHLIYNSLPAAYSPLHDNWWVELYEAAQTIRPP
jgi:hypothetical protein